MKKLSKQEELYLRELGKRIGEIRLGRNLSQVELAHRLDMEKSSINRIEKGNTNPTIITLKRICSELGIGLRELFEN